MYLFEFNITIKLGFNMRLLNAEYWQCANKILQNTEIYINMYIRQKSLENQSLKAKQA